MHVVKKTKAQLKNDEKRIQTLYRQGCSGIQVSIWDLSKIMQVGQDGIDAGLDDESLKAKILAFVETIRKN